MNAILARARDRAGARTIRAQVDALADQQRAAKRRRRRANMEDEDEDEDDDDDDLQIIDEDDKESEEENEDQEIIDAAYRMIQNWVMELRTGTKKEHDSWCTSGEAQDLFDKRKELFYYCGFLLGYEDGSDDEFDDDVPITTPLLPSPPLPISFTSLQDLNIAKGDAKLVYEDAKEKYRKMRYRLDGGPPWPPCPAT